MDAVTRIWLCDLTYTQQTISSDVMPAAVGCIAAFTKSYLSEPTEIRIFKFPEELARVLDAEAAPHVIAFSNYVWNRDLSAQFARTIKKHRPGVVTVMGGPNYPTVPAEQEEFIRRHPMIDFYVVKEGEVAFAKLVSALRRAGFDASRVPADLPSVHRILPDGRFHASPLEERITDLAQIPSPYLTGLMDKYFDGTMLPIVQTNRGCPFRCTFCIEGVSYYSRVAKSAGEKTGDELEYICSRMAALRAGGKGRSDLHIADSNFGMYKEDLAICAKIAEMQQKYRYPEYINVATGKNHKERVLEAARLLSGALRLSGSVQTLDKQVLKNIDRSNIDEQEILQLALAASDVGANSYSEIILGLPGDSRQSHVDSVRKIVEADFNTVALYQLMLLPGTDLAARESVTKWRMSTRYRVLPRCFGYFDVLGDEINAAEIEEICVSNDSLSFQDYLDCRHLHLIINVFYNDGVYKDVLRLLNVLGLRKFDWLERIWKHCGSGRYAQFVDGFLNDTEAELWESRPALRAFLRDRENIVRHIEGRLGANLVFKYKSLALVDYVEELAEVATTTLADLMRAHHVPSEAVRFGTELIEFSRLRMTNLFRNRSAEPRGRFYFDCIRFSNAPKPTSTEDFLLPEATEYRFVQTPEQARTIDEFRAVYGDSVSGLSRILSKVYVRRLYRVPNTLQLGAEAEFGSRQLTIADGQLSGLNEFV